MHVILTFFYLNSGFFDTRLKILTPTPHVTNRRHCLILQKTAAAVFMQKYKRCNKGSSSPLILGKLAIFLEFSQKHYLVPPDKVQSNYDGAQILASKFQHWLKWVLANNLWFDSGCPREGRVQRLGALSILSEEIHCAKLSENTQIN